MSWPYKLLVVLGTGGVTVRLDSIEFSPSNTSTILEYPDSHDLNFSNRLVRTRMPGGVAGVRLTAVPYADQQRKWYQICCQHRSHRRTSKLPQFAALQGGIFAGQR